MTKRRQSHDVFLEMFSRLQIFMLLLYCYPSSAMIDVTDKELQNVADHLSDSKCLELLEILKEKAKIIPAKYKGSEVYTEGESCISRLMDWANNEGGNADVLFLSNGIKQIGMNKLSSQLTRKVLHETVEELDQYSKDDPFTKMIPHKLFHFFKGVSFQKISTPSKDKTDHLFKAMVVIVMIISIVSCFYCCFYLCSRPTVGVCVRSFSQPCTNLIEMMSYGCMSLFGGADQGVNKYQQASSDGPEGQRLLV